MIVRYADDFVVGFEKANADEMLLALKARLAGFGLTLHEDKTRLIEFGRSAALSRQRRGQRRSETFAFLGFTHCCGRTRDGRFIVKHKTEGKRLTRKLAALRQEVWRFMHAPLAMEHDGSPPFCVDTTATMADRTTIRRSAASTGKCVGTGCATLRRRSQESRRMGWSEFESLTARFRLPVPRITRTCAQARI